MVRTSGAAGAGAGGGGAGGTDWAASGTAQPPSMVPTRNIAPARLLMHFVFEITRPRLFEKSWSALAAPSPCYCPAPTLLTNQALKPVPQADRSEIVKGSEYKQCQYRRDPAAERPFDRPLAEWTPPDGFDRVEEQMAAIQHRDWQEVDESEIN